MRLIYWVLLVFRKVTMKVKIGDSKLCHECISRDHLQHLIYIYIIMSIYAADLTVDLRLN